MIQIKLPDDMPPEIEEWRKRSEELTNLVLAAENTFERHRLIDVNKSHWRSPVLVNWLSDLSYEKCWYTETKFGGDYQEVEHFRPKKSTKNVKGTPVINHPGYYWLAFDLANYRLCKSRPNRKKSTFFPVVDERFRSTSRDEDWRDETPIFLDPLDEEDCLLLSFNDDGRPTVEGYVEDQDKLRVEFTIEKYFLDERVLNMRRAETWSTVRSLYYKYLTSMQEVKSAKGDKVALRESAKKDLQILKSMLGRDQEFSSVAKTSLIKTGDDRAVIIASSV